MMVTINAEKLATVLAEADIVSQYFQKGGDYEIVLRNAEPADKEMIEFKFRAYYDYYFEMITNFI
jgi:hypothetical protein